MKKRLLGTCPVCDGKLVVSELTCEQCHSKIQGEFPLNKFNYLTAQQQEFALVFLKNCGNIKQIEKELNISYPTVKKMLDSVIKDLGFENSYTLENKVTRQEVLAMLKSGELNFDEAETILKEIGE